MTRRVSDPFDTALIHAGTAMELLEHQRIPTTPANFAVMYHYVARHMTDLTAEADRLLRSSPLSEDICQRLHDRFLGGETEQQSLDQAGTRIDRAVTDAASVLETANDEAAQYGQALQAFSAALAQSEAAAEERIAAILAQTQGMADANRRLKEQLGGSVREITQLRQTLETAKHEALTDALTGLPNRRHFDTALDDMANQIGPGHDGLCLLMVDVDRFKAFNDTHGRQLGDQVLKLVARTITACVGPNDLAARYGGQEFAVILPLRSLTEAADIGEMIRARVAGRSVLNRRTGQNLGQITLSVGAAAYCAGEPQITLIRRADDALHRAKSTGRNRVLAG